MPAFSPKFAEKMYGDKNWSDDRNARFALATHVRGFIFRGPGERTRRRFTAGVMAGTRVQGGLRGGDFNPTAGPLKGTSVNWTQNNADGTPNS